MIKKVGNKYKVVSEKTGKNLSKPSSKAKAVKRLKQVEYFKHKKKTFGSQMKKVHKIMSGY